MSRPSILAYHFPQWHVDARNEQWHGPGWTEWELAKVNYPRFDGHTPPEPQWGYYDEADPQQMAREIDLAADHGLDGFLFDVYWYEDGPFLQRAVTDGFLQAPNRSRLKFACMWANHTWRNWHPVKATQAPWTDAALLDGRVSAESFDRFTDIVTDWIAQPEYFRLNGQPYFSIYEIYTFVDGLGGEDAAARALDKFRDKVRRRTGEELHLGALRLRLGVTGDEARARLQKLGVASITPYNNLDHGPMDRMAFPRGDYNAFHAAARDAWSVTDAETGAAYIPNITTGWDSSGRACPSDAWQRRDYPWFPVIEANRAEWTQALTDLKQWFDQHDDALPLATINAWNEWTEGAILLPTRKDGNMRLEAFTEVFGPRP